MLPTALANAITQIIDIISITVTMRVSNQILLLPSLFNICYTHPTSNDITAITKQGKVAGIKASDDVNAFLGIPFAKPPVGSLRWKPPVTPDKFGDSKIFNASSFGNSCFQFHYALFNTSGNTGTGPDPTLAENNQSEDCLTLNVFVPRGQPSKKLPVFFWSYGGDYVEGSSALAVYNPTNFVQEMKDIIVVTAK
jgi:carboxylesterase type B